MFDEEVEPMSEKKSNSFASLVKDGTDLLDKYDHPSDAHNHFGRWVHDVMEWLEEKFPDTGLCAKWSSLPTSQLVIGRQYDDDRETWVKFHHAVQVRLSFLGELGRTIIEKLEGHSSVGFAVVLLTPDDVGRSAETEHLRPRARQNVILELGFFCGTLGRSHVCALHKGDLELPSDFEGVIYVRFDDGDAWRLSLARELKAAGLPVDLNEAV